MFQEITDPELLAELESSSQNTGGGPQGLPSGAPEGQMPEQTQQQSPGFFQGMSEAPGHAMEAMGGAWNAYAAEAARAGKDEDLSRYSEKKLKANLSKMQDAESKMGMGAQIGSGIIQSLPVAASMVVPGGQGAGVARLAALGATSYGQNVGNVLVEQEKTGYGRDYEQAKSAGAKMAGTDLALGMLPTGAIKGATGKIAADAAVGGASGAQQTVHTNLATGRDWNEGIVEGTVMGGVAGGGLSGLNQAMGVNWNQAGKDAVQNIKNFGRNNTHTPSRSLQEDYVEYNNINQDLNQRIKETPPGEELNSLVEQKFNVDRQGVQEASIVDAANLLNEAGVKTDLGFFDYEVPTFDGTGFRGHAAELMGSTRRTATDANVVSRKARKGLGTSDAMDKGLTFASSMKDLQVKGKDIIGKSVGTMQQNVDSITNQIRAAKEANLNAKTDPNAVPVDETYIAKMTLLQDYMKNINANYSKYLSSQRVQNFKTLEDDAKQAYRLAAELGVMKDLVDIQGKPGSFDPIKGLATIDHMYHQVKAKYPQFTMGTPDVVKEATQPLFTRTDIMGTVATGGAYAAVSAGRIATRPFTAALSQRRLRKQQEAGSSFVKGITGKLNEAAAAKRDADALKAEADIVKAENDVAIAQAKAEASAVKAEADIAKEAEITAKEVKDSAARERTTARSEQLKSDLDSGDLDKGTNTAVSFLEESGINTNPKPTPSIFGSEVTLAGTAKRPEQFSDTVRAERDIMVAQEKAQADAQAAQEAAQRANDMRAMARQRQVAEEGTVSPARADEDSPEVRIAQQEAEMAAQQAEQSAQQAAMIAERNQAANALARQEASVQRGTADQTARAEETARLAREEELGVIAQEEAARRASEREATEGLITRPIQREEPVVEPEVIPEPVTKPETPKKAPDQGVVKRPTAPKKPVEETSKDVDTTAPTKEEIAIEERTDVPEATKAFDLVRLANRKEIERLKKVSERTPEISKKLHALETKEAKLHKAFKTFNDRYGSRHRDEDVKAVFDEFTDAEIHDGVNIADVNAKLNKLYNKQEVEAGKILEDLEPVKGLDETPVKITREEVQKQKVETEWKAIDEMAGNSGYSKAQVDQAIKDLGTERGRPVKAETVMRKILANESKALNKTPATISKTYTPSEAKSSISDLGKKLGLPGSEVSKIIDSNLGAFKGPISDAKVQSTFGKVYDAVNSANKKAEVELKETLRLDKEALSNAKTDEHRKALRDRVKEKTEALEKLADVKKAAIEQMEKSKAMASKSKDDAIKAATQAQERAKLEAATKLVDSIERQKKVALDKLKEKGVSDEDLELYESDFLANITKPHADDQTAVTKALSWLKTKDKEVSAKDAASVDEVNKRIAEVENKVLKALSNKDVPNVNIVVNQIIEGKTPNVRKATGEMSSMINKLGSLKAIEASGLKMEKQTEDFNKALIKTYEYALEQKVKHPENPDLWLSKELYENMRDAIVGVGSSSAYFGRHGPTIRADIFGSTHHKEFFSAEEIGKMNKEINDAKSKELDLEGMTIR